MGCRCAGSSARGSSYKALRAQSVPEAAVCCSLMQPCGWHRLLTDAKELLWCGSKSAQNICFQSLVHVLLGHGRQWLSNSIHTPPRQVNFPNRSASQTGQLHRQVRLPGRSASPTGQPPRQVSSQDKSTFQIGQPPRQVSTLGRSAYQAGRRRLSSGVCESVRSTLAKSFQTVLKGPHSHNERCCFASAHCGAYWAYVGPAWGHVCMCSQSVLYILELS